MANFVVLVIAWCVASCGSAGVRPSPAGTSLARSGAAPSKTRETPPQTAKQPDTHSRAEAWLTHHFPVDHGRWPRSINAFRLQVPYIELAEAVCGNRDLRPTLASPLIKGDSSFLTDLAILLNSPQDGQKVLQCHHELEAAVPKDAPIVAAGDGATFAYFVRLPMTDLPATGDYKWDGDGLEGLVKARCFYGMLAPHPGPCSPGSDPIMAKWPEGQWWVFGRYEHVMSFVDLTKQPPSQEPFKHLAALTQMLQLASDLAVEIDFINLEPCCEEYGFVGYMGGESSGRYARVSLAPNKREADERLRTYERRFSAPPSTGTLSPSLFEPALRKVMERETVEANAPAPPSLKQIGNAVVTMGAVETTPSMSTALRQMHQHRERELQDAMEKWRTEGVPPSKEWLRKRKGAAFVKDLAKERRKRRG